MRQAFENEGLESKVLKTWTPPKPGVCKRKWARFNRRLCDNMEKEFENLQKVNLREKSDGKISSAVEAAEPSGEGLNSTSVENPSLNCNMGKTETGKSSGEGDEDHCADLDSNDEGLEPESELWRGSEEQPVRQEGFVQQPAKQEAVPRASEQKVIDEDDEQGHNLIKDQFYNGFRDQLIRTFQMHGAGAE